MRSAEPRTAFLLICCLVAAYLTLIGVCALRGQPQKKDTYSYADGSELVVPFSLPYYLGGQSVRVGNGCVSVDGVIGAGRFFFDLKKKNTPQGPIFRVGHRVVTDFPDQVRVVVTLASGVPCSRNVPPGPVIPSLDPLKSLRAEAVYIRDLKKYPLEINLEQEGDDAPPGRPEFLAGRLWYYRYELKSEGVLLTDALLITLYSKEHTEIAKLSWRQ